MRNNRTDLGTKANSLLVLVCTYNERKNVERLIESIHVAVPQADILIIDDTPSDGRGDGTGEAIQELISSNRFGNQLKLKSREGKQGLGSAIRDGLRTAIDDDYELVVNLDADFSHDPRMIPDVVGAMIPSVDLAIGSRYVRGGGMVNCSWKRILVSKLANAYARLLLGWKINDCSSAFRCYRVDALRLLPWDKIQCEGYGFLEEILWYLLHTKPNNTNSKADSPENPNTRIVEIPIIYTERELGDSKISMKEATGALSVLHRLWRIRMRLQ